MINLISIVLSKTKYFKQDKKRARLFCVNAAIAMKALIKKHIYLLYRYTHTSNIVHVSCVMSTHKPAIVD